MTDQPDFDFEGFKRSREKKRLVRGGLAVGALFLILAGLYFLWNREDGTLVAPRSSPLPQRSAVPAFPTPPFTLSNELEVLPETIESEGEPEETAGEPEEIPGQALPLLDESDDFVRQLLAGFLPVLMPDSWMESEDLVRLFVVSIDNIAGGSSPRQHLLPAAPEEKFEFLEVGEAIHLDPESYSRYDRISDIFSSLDPGHSARAYGILSGYFQQAYSDLGYEDRSFEQTMERAIQRILDAPVVRGEVLLLRGDDAFHFLDPALENLSQAEKHMLRMGPENTEKIQASLREIVKALDLSPM